MSKPSRNETPAHKATTSMIVLPTDEPSTMLTTSTCFPPVLAMAPSLVSRLARQWPAVFGIPARDGLNSLRVKLRCSFCCDDQATLPGCAPVLVFAQYSGDDLVCLSFCGSS